MEGYQRHEDEITPTHAPVHQSIDPNDLRKDEMNPDYDYSHVQDARPILPKAAFFMGDLRDGLAMVRVVMETLTVAIGLH